MYKLSASFINVSTGFNSARSISDRVKKSCIVGSRNAMAVVKLPEVASWRDDNWLLLLFRMAVC